MTVVEKVKRAAKSATAHAEEVVEGPTMEQQILSGVRELGTHYSQLAAATQGLHLNDVLTTRRLETDGNGLASISHRVAGAAVTVWNDSSAHVLITNLGPQSPGKQGAGMAEIGAGAWATFPFAGNAYSFYSRPHRRFTVAIHSRVLDPAGGNLGDAPWPTVNAGAGGVAASALIDTHPWYTAGLVPIYGGYSFIEPNGADATFRVWDGQASGFANAKYLGGLTVGPNQSVELELDGGKRADSGSLYFELASGALNGVLLIR